MRHSVSSNTEAHEMGKLDQFIKGVFTQDTPIITENGAVFEVPPEIPTTELQGDGLLTITNPELFSKLPAPWSFAAKSRQILLEFKMQKDKFPPASYERALFRRQALQVRQMEALPEGSTLPPIGLWIVTSSCKEWMIPTENIQDVGPGCYQMWPYEYPIDLIAANELPLGPAMMPFLVARMGKKLVEFARWLLRENPKRLRQLLEVVHMDTELYKNMTEEDEADEKLILWGQRYLAETFAQKTGLRNEWKKEDDLEARLQTLEHQFSRRLGRALQEGKQALLRSKLETLGTERLSDVVLDLDRDALHTWLLDPNAQ